MSEDEATAGSAASIASFMSALLLTNTPHWGTGNTVLNGSAVGRGATLSFAFMTSVRQTALLDSYGFAAMSTVQKAAVRQALATWSAVANIGFVETADVANATITFATNRQFGQSAAYAYYPSTRATGGAVFVANDSAANSNPTAGSYGFMTLVHEIGHALGLKHPGNYNAGSTSGGAGPYLSAAEDNDLYSVMSYNSHGSLPAGAYPTGPSLYDIATIQYLYGANMAAAPGHDSYALTSAAYRTLWDPNGVNTLSGAGQTAALSIDLRDGHFSSVGTVASVGLAYGTRVQKAIGGSADDVFTVNGLGDWIDGGAGDDTVVLGGARSQYKVATVGGACVVSNAQGGNVLNDVQYLRFSDGTVPVAAAVTGAFDAARYLASNRDLIPALGADTAAATSHYLSLGVLEGRSLTSFDPYNYLAGNGDLAAVFGTDAAAATWHFVTDGQREGRSATAFDALAYAGSNPDLIRVFGSDTEALERHYLTQGRFENRSTTAFSAASYLAANADLRAALGGDLTAAKRHYVEFGHAEGRAVA